MVGCEHCHTGNCLGNSACACVVVLNKLNSFVSWVDTVHGDVSLVFVFCLVVASNGDVFAKFGVDNCNCCVCAPSTANCCFACCYAFVSGKLTTIEDCAVYDSIVCTLVGALERCDVACCARVVLACVNHVDCAVFEVGCAVCTEDKVGVAGDEHLFEVVTTCEQLECILDSKEATVLHCEHIRLNEQCKVTFDCKSCFVKSCLAVPVVGNCNAFDNAVNCLFTYCYCCGGVGCVSETACVVKTVERIPLDYNVISLFAKTNNVEVRNGDFQFFPVVAWANVEFLLSGCIGILEEIKRLLDCAEYVVNTAYRTA